MRYNLCPCGFQGDGLKMFSAQWHTEHLFAHIEKYPLSDQVTTDNLIDRIRAEMRRTGDLDERECVVCSTIHRDEYAAVACSRGDVECLVQEELVPEYMVSRGFRMRGNGMSPLCSRCGFVGSPVGAYTEDGVCEPCILTALQDEGDLRETNFEAGECDSAGVKEAGAKAKGEDKQ
jgi:hypothetical protein